MIIPAFTTQIKFKKNKSNCFQFSMHPLITRIVCMLNFPAIILHALQNSITCQKTESFTTESGNSHDLLPCPASAQGALAKCCCSRHLLDSCSVLTVTSPRAAAGEVTAQWILQQQRAVSPVRCLLLETTALKRPQSFQIFNCSSSVIVVLGLRNCNH